MAALRWLTLALAALVALALALLVAGQAGLLRGSRPDDLGVRDGRLKAPSNTPNSVSSQADLWPDASRRAYARIAPLRLVGDGAATLTRLRSIVESMPGAKVVSAGDVYLYATFTTRWLKFTDDVEFWFDAVQGVVQVRSASRLGRRDFGVNRERVEAIRLRLAAP